MSLTLNIATRGRPLILREMVERTLPNMTLASSRLMISVDDDDSETVESLEALPDDPRLVLSIAPREDTRGEKYDRALKEAPADIYMPLSDYTPILRPGFDVEVERAAALFPDGIGCVYTPLINASFPGIQCPTAGLVERLGYIYPRWFPYWFIDHWLDDVVRMIDRYVTVDLGSDHVSLVNKRRTIGLRDLWFWTTFFDDFATERRQEAETIIGGLMEPEWRKAALRSNFGLVEYRSRWINDCVRRDAAVIEAAHPSEPDARYARIKARAEARLAGHLKSRIAELSAAVERGFRGDYLKGAA